MKKIIIITLSVIFGLALLLWIRKMIVYRPTKYVTELQKPADYKEVIDHSIDPNEIDEPILQVPGTYSNVAESGEDNVGIETNSKPITQGEVFVAENVIKDLLNAENEKDISKVISFFNYDIERYWDYKNIKKEKLKEIYFRAWVNIDDASYSNISVQNTNLNTYDLYALYSYRSAKDGSKKTANVHTRYVFDLNGEIISTYGVN